jgi:uncharacterized heparinase superfamily protein
VNPEGLSIQDKVFRWLRTVRYLRPIQIVGRFWLKAYRPRLGLSPAPGLRAVSGQWCEPAQKRASLLRPWRFRFLNVEHELAEPTDWNNPTYDTLWLYNLHYFDDINAEVATSQVEWHRELLLRWVAENQPARGVGWAPYPTSQRIVNWIKWSLAGNLLPDVCLHSLAVQTRWLRRRLEYHLLGNHLFANAKALVFAGVFFDGDEANSWLQKGMAILDKQIPVQILADGGHIERSPMYHALVFEDMLDLCNLATAYPAAFLHYQKSIAGWPVVIERMGRWLAAMCHPDGEVAFFNDSAMGIAPPQAELNQYAQRLGLSLDPLGEGATPLRDSGYIRVKQSSMFAVLDTAPLGPDYLPGHAHADTLSFELSLFGQRVFVNSGTSTYEPGELRHWQRSTAAHNTVVIDGENSSEVWAGFRVGRRAKPSVPVIDEDGETLLITASHDGYRRLTGKNDHQRRWQFHSDVILIEDRITGPFQKAIGRFYLHPDVKSETLPAADGIRLQLPQGQAIEMSVEGGRLLVEGSHWYPEFGVSVPNKCLIVNCMQADVRLKIQPVPSGID